MVLKMPAGHRSGKQEQGLDAENAADSITETSIRNGFISKVYGLLAVQFIFTFVIIATIYISKPIQDYYFEHGWLFWVIMVGLMAILIVLMCCERCRKTVPLNFILLIALTFFMGTMLGFTCIQYRLHAILWAAGLTILVCLSVSMFSCSTSFDFTKWQWVMCIVLLMFLVAGVIMIFVHNQIAQIAYAAIGVGIFTIYLAIDTQMIVGGRQAEYSTEEYIMATIQLYLDIINIFLYMLTIFNK